MSNFPYALAYVLKNEAGFFDCPDDRGGPTNMGITLATLARYRKSATVSRQDVLNLSREEAVAIYRELWWTPLRCAEVWANSKATAILDAGVLFGVRESGLCAQRAANFSRLTPGTSPPPERVLKVDGDLGSMSIDRINSCNTSLWLQAFVAALVSLVDEIESTHPTDKRFAAGWRDRVQRYLSL